MSDTKRELFDKLRYEIHMADMLATEMNHSRGISLETVSMIEKRASKASELASALRAAMVKKPVVGDVQVTAG